MSYYPNSCGVFYFTPNQYALIGQALETRKTYITYTMTAPPMAVNNPSGLAATQSNLAVVLNWTDNASNEMGYLIERSTTSASDGFQAVIFGGTAANATTFTDNTVAANTTYYYRIKASNGQNDGYSNVATMAVTPQYCTSTYSNACAVVAANQISIQGVRLSTTGGTMLFQNGITGCTGALSDYTSIFGNVTAGTSYKIEVQPTFTNGGCSNVKTGFWIDANNDKDFDDAGEFLGIYNSAGCLASGNITIPVGTLNGACRFRIRATSLNLTLTSADACTNLINGETEDYTLNVTGGATLPTKLLRFEGKYTEGSHQLTWQTESEVNAAYFDVERSLNGQYFDKIATVKAFGKANTYALEDKKVTQNTVYYRLKMVDNNGSFEYSKIIALHAGKHNNVLYIFPNPVTEFLTIETTDEGDRQVVNLLGQTVLRSKATQQIDVSTLPSGTYFLKVGGQQARFVKQ
jgi:GEVED domain/Secretion system C-terminal sorting domain